jgi:hypothetical protein
MSKVKKTLTRKTKSVIQKQTKRRIPARGKAANRPQERRGKKHN